MQQRGQEDRDMIFLRACGIDEVVMDIQKREKVYFPQYNKIYVGLNDSNKTKRRVAGKAQGTS